MNILLIVVDDLGWHDIGYHGSEIRTPNLDRLSSTGVRLEQFYVLQACTPTRSALMTGQYPLRLGMQCIVWPWSDYGLDSTVPTLANQLKSVGYKNYLVGKWHLGHNAAEYLPLNRGFDYHCGCYTGSIDSYDHTTEGVHDYVENGHPVYPEGHITDICADKSISLINGHDWNNPMFLYLAFNAPHVPLQAPEKFVNMYKEMEEPRKTFAAMCSHVDEAVERVRIALEKVGQLDNTLIWFTSDNGGWLGYGGDNQPYRGGKVTNYEGGLRVPSFVCHKDLVPGVFNSLSHATDVMPTLCAVVGAATPPVIDGVNLWPQLMGDVKPTPRIIVHHYVENKTGFSGCLVDGKWKVIKYKKTELFDIEHDPLETIDLAERHPELTQFLIDKLQSYGPLYRAEPLVRWVAPNGYPEGYVLPTRWWGEPSERIKILSISEDNRNLAECDLADLFGLNEFLEKQG